MHHGGHHRGLAVEALLRAGEVKNGDNGLENELKETAVLWLVQVEDQGKTRELDARLAIEMLKGLFCGQQGEGGTDGRHDILAHVLAGEKLAEPRFKLIEARHQMLLQYILAI